MIFGVLGQFALGQDAEDGSAAGSVVTAVASIAAGAVTGDALAPGSTLVASVSIFASGATAGDASAIGDIVDVALVLIAGGATVGSNDGAAAGDSLVTDASLIAGQARGNGSNEIGFWGPPARPTLLSWYRAPRIDRHVDALVRGQLLTVGCRMIGGTASGDATDHERVLMVNFQLIADVARGYVPPAVVPANPPREIERFPEDDELVPQEILWHWRNPWHRAANVRERAAAAPRGPTGWHSAVTIRKRVRSANAPPTGRDLQADGFPPAGSGVGDDFRGSLLGAPIPGGDHSRA